MTRRTSDRLSEVRLRTIDTPDFCVERREGDGLPRVHSTTKYGGRILRVIPVIGMGKDLVTAAVSSVVELASRQNRFHVPRHVDSTVLPFFELLGSSVVMN